MNTDTKALAALATVTMSTVEIHERTGKTHGNVMRDTRVMLEALGLPLFKFEASYLAGNGKIEACYHLPKDLTLTLITGYSIPLRAAVVRRWQELEAQQAPTIPNFANPAEAARAWASEYDAKQLAHERIKVLEPMAAVGEQVAMCKISAANLCDGIDRFRAASFPRATPSA